MKKHALLLGLSAWFIPAVASADMMSVSAKAASFRSGPSPKDKVLFSADLYYPVQVLEKKGTWTKVRDFEGETAWVTSQHLAAKPTVVIQADKANIREKASTDSDVLFQVERGEVFKVVDRKGNWVSVIDANKDGGWIRADMTWGLEEPKSEAASGDDVKQPECTCAKQGNEIATKSEKADKADKSEKADKADKSEKADKAEKADKSEKAEKADKSEKAEKADADGPEVATQDDATTSAAKPEKPAAKPHGDKAHGDKAHGDKAHGDKGHKPQKAQPEKAPKAQPEKKKRK